jgi:hypothetical protein
MAAPAGNRFWELRCTHGRKRIFSKPDALWKACCGYFEWVQDTPLEEEKAFHSEGMITKTNVNKLRAMTIYGLCRYLDIDRDTWDEYRSREDFSSIIKRVENVIKEQKFTGAAAGLLNANIISRELGMADKHVHSLTLESLVAGSMPGNDEGNG